MLTAISPRKLLLKEWHGTFRHSRGFYKLEHFISLELKSDGIGSTEAHERTQSSQMRKGLSGDLF